MGKKCISVSADSPKEQQNLDVPHKEELTTILREGWILFMNCFYPNLTQQSTCARLSEDLYCAAF